MEARASTSADELRGLRVSEAMKWKREDDECGAGAVGELIAERRRENSRDNLLSDVGFGSGGRKNCGGQWGAGAERLAF